jgi:hypothetical protein
LRTSIDNVFVGAASTHAAQVAKLERQAKQIDSSIAFLQRGRDRERAVENADWAVEHGRISVNQRQDVIEMGLSNPTRQAEWIMLQPAHSSVRATEDATCAMMGVSREEFVAMRARETGVGLSVHTGHSTVSVSPSSPNITDAGMGGPQIMPKFSGGAY